MRLLLFVALLLMSGVAFSDSVPMQGNVISHGLTGIGTLADANNPVEMELAPQHTRLIALRNRLARKLYYATNNEIGKIVYFPKEILRSAIEISSQTDHIRSQLDQLSKQPYDADFKMQVLAVQKSLTEAETNYDYLSRRIDAALVEK